MEELTVQGNIAFIRLDQGKAEARVMIYHCPRCHRRHREKVISIVSPNFNENLVVVDAPCGRIRVGLYNEAQLARQQLDQKIMPWSVYFLLVPNAGLIRIGQTGDQASRLADHNAEQAVSVELYGLIQDMPHEIASRSVELYLHHAFRSAFHHGSWYTFEAIQSNVNLLFTDLSSFVSKYGANEHLQRATLWTANKP